MDIKFPPSSCTKDGFFPAKSIENPWPDPNINEPGSPFHEPLMNPHLAALKLQKTYKSFRTRRQLADCAILAEHRWWKLLDFAELKCSSVSYFETDKQETAVSRWSRARTRAAKVGKGSSRNAKACKLALQHWLEAIDPRHRYGHNLHFYFVKWLHCQSRQPFFYWLDIGEGKEWSLEKCPRPKLQKQCIKYLSPIEREAYEVTVEDGKFIYKLTRKLIDTRTGPTKTKWIFVLNTSNILYVGMKRKGKFQHSSFLAGGATLSAGQLVVIDGTLKAAWPHSGHYLPTKENFDAFILFLEQHHIDVQTIKKYLDDEEEVSNKKVAAYAIHDCVDRISEPGISRAKEETENESDTTIEIAKREDIFTGFRKKQPGPSSELEPNCSSDDEDELTDELLSSIKLMASRHNHFYFSEEARVNPIPEEKIMQRINSRKETRFFRLAKHLGSQVNGGAGTRDGHVCAYAS